MVDAAPLSDEEDAELLRADGQHIRPPGQQLQPHQQPPQSKAAWLLHCLRVRSTMPVAVTRSHPAVSVYMVALQLLSFWLLAAAVSSWSNSGVMLTSDDVDVDWACPPSLARSPWSPSRVLILTTDDRPMPPLSSLPASSLSVLSWPYYVLTHHINVRYAAHHGYEYRRITAAMLQDDGPQRSSVWGKLYHLLHSVDWSRYDWIVGLDSDAWFANRSRSLHDVLNCFAPAMLRAAADHVDTAAPRPVPSLLISLDYASVERLNAGVLVIRSTAAGLQLCSRWWEAAKRAELRHLLTEWPAEQGVLNDVIMANVSMAALVQPLPRQVIYGHAAHYINHVTSWWPRQRGWQHGRREQLMLHTLVMDEIRAADTLSQT